MNDFNQAPSSNPSQIGRAILWLAVLFLGLVFLNLALVYRHESSGQFGMTLLCWAAVGLSLRRHHAYFRQMKGGWSGRLSGTLLIALLLVSVVWRPLSWTHLLALYPVWAGVGLGLVAAGFTGMFRFWRELTILFFLGIPHGFLLNTIDLSGATARFAALLLHYVGKDVVLNGTEIALPGGAVEVVKSCDGTSAIAYLLCLAVVFLLLFPATRGQRLTMIPVAMGTAFVTNAVRIAMLAVIEASAGTHAFDYWHTGRGAMLWTAIPVALFGIICFFALRYEQRRSDAESRSKSEADRRSTGLVAGD